MRVIIKNVRADEPSALLVGRGWGDGGWFEIEEVEVEVYPDGSFRIQVWDEERRQGIPSIKFSLPDVQRRTLIQALRGDLPAEE